MINLNDIIQSAQGGQAVDNLASRFGITPQQAQSAINAILPAIEMGMKNAGASGQAGTILSQLGSAAHQQSYADPSTVDTGAAATHGGSILGGLFGGQHNTSAVTQQAATESGLSASVIQAMLPVIASIVMGGLFHGGQGGAFGGTLSNILGSVLGQGGSIFGSGSQPAPSTQEAGGGLGGMLGSVLGGLFGGGPVMAPSAAPGDDVPPAAGNVPPAGNVAAGSASSMLDEISNMVEAGTPASPEHQNRLADILGR